MVGNASQQFSEAATRSAEAVVGLGMLNAVIGRWRAERNKAVQEQLIASGRGVVFSSFLGGRPHFHAGRLMAVGAVQVINGEIPFGLVFASIFIFGFAMKPMDQLIRPGRTTIRSRMRCSGSIWPSSSRLSRRPPCTCRAPRDYHVPGRHVRAAGFGSGGA